MEACEAGSLGQDGQKGHHIPGGVEEILTALRLKGCSCVFPWCPISCAHLALQDQMGRGGRLWPLQTQSSRNPSGSCSEVSAVITRTDRCSLWATARGSHVVSTSF